MARYSTRPTGPADELGLLIGRAISEGILEGLRSSIEEARQSLTPLQNEVLEIFRRDALAQLDDEKREAEELANVLRPCDEPGCDRQAVARGLCRRHYARLTYRERRERQGATVSPRAERALPASPPKVKRQDVAAIAPIVRRKKEQEDRGAEAAVAEAAEAKKEVSVDSVARFFGIGNK